MVGALAAGSGLFFLRWWVQLYARAEILVAEDVRRAELRWDKVHKALHPYG